MSSSGVSLRILHYDDLLQLVHQFLDIRDVVAPRFRRAVDEEQDGLGEPRRHVSDLREVQRS